jgi:serine/threonine protein kinase
MEFMAPELLVPSSSSPGGTKKKHSTSADLWACGIVLYYLAYSCVPYSQVDDVDVLRNEIAGFRAPVCDVRCRERVGGIVEGLIGELLDLEPRRRPTCEDILKRLK